MVTLSVAIDAIMDGIIADLNAERANGQSLEDVILLARGDRAEPSPDVPAIYATPMDMAISTRQGTTMNLTEWWEMPVQLASMVKNDIPASGYQAATDLVARARAVLITLNSTNFDLAYVKDVRSGKFQPAGPWSRENDYYRATATVVVLFSARG